MEVKPQRRILVVDDEPVNLEIAGGYLEAAGYAVITAADGTEGLERAEQDQPDVIILDVMMPHLTGFVVCRRLKSKPSTAHIPVLFFTGVDFEEARKKAEECGAQGYLTKPIDHVEMIRLIKEVLGED